MIVRLVAMATLCSALATQAHADEGPRYEETVEFIASKLHRGYFFRETENCNFKYGSNQTNWSFKAADLDPSRVEIDSLGAFFYTREERNLINYYDKGATNELMMVSLVPLNGNFSIRPPIRVNTDKVIRAMTHLIMICGGTEELF